MGEEALLCLKLAGVDAAAACFDAHGMLQVKHLVIEEVFDGRPWSVRAIKHAADDDGVVGSVVVAEHAASVVGAPGEDGTPEKAMEEARVEGIEDLVEVEMVSVWGKDAFAAASLADVFGLPGDRLGGDVAAVAIGVRGRDGLLVELGEQDVRDGVVDGLWRVLEKVGEADVQAAFTQPDSGVQRSKPAEANIEGRDRRTWTEAAVLLLKDGDKRGVHCESRLTCRSVDSTRA